MDEVIGLIIPSSNHCVCVRLKVDATGLLEQRLLLLNWAYSLCEIIITAILRPSKTVYSLSFPLPAPTPCGCWVPQPPPLP